MENLLIFLEIWGEAKLILRIWGAKENIFREQRYFLSGSWGDQCIIFRGQGSTDPPGGPHKYIEQKIEDTGLIKSGISCQKADLCATYKQIQTP